MTRRLLNLITVLSLLLFLAVAGLWVRARRTDDTVVWSIGNRIHLILGSRRPGWVEVTGVSNPRRITHRYSRSRWVTHNLGGWSWRERAPASAGRFRLVRGSVIEWRPPESPNRPYGAWSAPMAAVEFASPMEHLVVATAILPAVRLIRRGFVEARSLRRWRLWRRGLCANCGYDVRASAGRCPECGRALEAVAAPTWARFVAGLSGPRRVVIAAMALATVQSWAFPLEWFHSYHVSLRSAGGCFVLMTRDSDVFVTRAWMPYPLLAAAVLVRPLIAFRRARCKWRDV